MIVFAFAGDSTMTSASLMRRARATGAPVSSSVTSGAALAFVAFAFAGAFAFAVALAFAGAFAFAAVFVAFSFGGVFAFATGFFAFGSVVSIAEGAFLVGTEHLEFSARQTPDPARELRLCKDRERRQ